MIQHYKVHNHHHHSSSSSSSSPPSPPPPPPLQGFNKKTMHKCTNAPTTFQQENPWHPHCFPSPPHHKTLLDATTAAKKLFVVATVVVGLLERERERETREP
jgi:hypothetical protein